MITGAQCDLILLLICGAFALLAGDRQRMPGTSLFTLIFLLSGASATILSVGLLVVLALQAP